MTDIEGINTRLRELAFELEEIRESKFIICVCDDEQETDGLVEKLTTLLAAKKRVTVSVSVSLWNRKDSLVQILISSNKDGNADVIHLRSIHLLPRTVLDRFFAELNFQRDTLARLGVPLVLWLNNKSLQRLVSKAPDFWSRRHEVYKFDTLSVDALLSRMFAAREGDPRTAASDKGLSDALSEILRSERELQLCLDRKSQFSLTKADNLISIIRKRLNELTAACRNDRQMEVALWLWNTSRFDEQLQQLAEHADKFSREIYEVLYADRNDVLLYMSEHIANLLEEYGDGLEKRIRNRQILSLTKLYLDTALKKFAAMARSLRSVDLNLDELIDHGFDRYEQDYRGENQFRAMAASQLETWLTGESKKRPPIFSAEEESLLRALYLGPSAGDVAIQGASEPELKQRLADLERKVRLFLGVNVR